jgi:hypothetical protein
VGALGACPKCTRPIPVGRPSCIYCGTARDARPEDFTLGEKVDERTPRAVIEHYVYTAINIPFGLTLAVWQPDGENPFGVLLKIVLTAAGIYVLIKQAYQFHQSSGVMAEACDSSELTRRAVAATCIGVGLVGLWLLASSGYLLVFDRKVGRILQGIIGLASGGFASGYFLWAGSKILRRVD